MSVARKGIILLAVPLFFELSFLVALSILHGQAENEASKYFHSAEISNCSNRVIRNILQIASLSRSDISAKDLAKLYQISVDKVRGELVLLQHLVKNNPQQLSVVKQSVAAGEEANTILSQLRGAYEEGGSYSLLEQFNLSRSKLRSFLIRMISPDFLAMAQAEDEKGKESPELQAHIRDQVKQVLIVAVIFNIGLTILIALIFSKQIVARLKVIVDNSFRLASNLPLNKPLPYGDEISLLDHSFHEMAFALAEAKHKEMALIDNAVDVICSLDSNLHFISISPAVEKIFGYQPTELLSTSIKLIVTEESYDSTFAQFQEVMNGKQESTFETRILRKDGHIIDALWSICWSSLERSIFCVVHDMTERKEVERMKQEVTAMVTHDLRTPLTTIKNFHEMVGTGMFGDLSKRGKELLQTAENNTERMLALIHDLLEIEKIKSGQLTINRQELELLPLLSQVTKTLDALASQAGIQLIVDKNGGNKSKLKIKADGHRLNQLLTNLLSNALKFAPSGSAIKISLHSNHSEAVVKIADQGRGIPNEYKQTIFERFKQVKTKEDGEKGGTGLGLAICKAIIEAHAGKIWVEDNPNGGSVFIFTLPLCH